MIGVARLIQMCSKQEKQTVQLGDNIETSWVKAIVQA